MSDNPDLTVDDESHKWIIFDRQTDAGYPLVVFSRANNPSVEMSLQESLISIVECQADISLVNDKQMPLHTDRLYDVEDGLARELAALGVGALHLGSVTGDGLRRIVYGHSSPLYFEPILELFNVEGYSLSAKQIHDRQPIITLLMPTYMEEQLQADMQVISSLEKNGDDCQIVRKADFWFYGSRASLEALSEDLEPLGYSIDHWIDDPQGVVLSKETSVDFASFKEITPVLVGLAQQQGIDYDGWETFVSLPDGGKPALTKPKSLLSRLFGSKEN